MCNVKGRKQGFMDMQLFQKVLSEAKLIGLNSIHLNYGGEPFLHPEIGNMLQTAHQMGFTQVSFFTNGTLIAPYVNHIAKYVSNIIFSVDGIGKVNDNIRIGDKYEIVLQNILNLRQARQKMGSALHIAVNCTWTTQSKNEIDDFVKTLSEIADRVRVAPARDLDNKLIRKNFDETKIVQHKFCSHSLKGLLVLWDGSVAFCTCGGAFPFVVGNANKKTISQIWHSESMRKMRFEALRFGSPKNEVCEKCDIWKDVIDTIIDVNTPVKPGLLETYVETPVVLSPQSL
jgi:radical SAM protein with 4Fe4S-binding SPASM domain